jgi:hypothetical protein
METAFFIDGFNFYHSLKTVRGPLANRLRWFDYVSYCERFMKSADTLKEVYYFTALAFWRSTEAVLRHKIFIDASEARGVKVVLGKFKAKSAQCPARAGFSFALNQADHAGSKYSWQTCSQFA